MALREGHLNIVEFLVEQWTDVDIGDGIPLLMNASMRGHFELMKLSAGYHNCRQRSRYCVDVRLLLKTSRL